MVCWGRKSVWGCKGEVIREVAKGSFCAVENRTVGGLGERFREPFGYEKSSQVRFFGRKFAVTYGKCPAGLDW